MNFSFRNANRPPIFSQAGFIFNFDKFAFLCTACSSFGNRILLHYRRWVLDLIPQQHKSSDILEIFIGWSMKTQRQDPLDLNSNFVVTHGKLIETHDIFVFTLSIVFIIDKDWSDRAITLFCDCSESSAFCCVEVKYLFFLFLRSFRYFCVAILAEDTRSSLQV